MPIDVFMTQLSPTMTEGKIARWLKKEGDTLESGEVLAEIETDKATMEMEVIEEGVLHKILAPEGSIVTVGAAIAVIAEDGEAIASDYVPESGVAVPAAPEQAAPATVAKQAAPAQAAPAPAPELDMAAIERAANDKRIKASPLARRLAKQKRINLAAITGTGPNGRIVKADIENAVTRGIKLGVGPVTALPAVRPMPTGPLPYHEDEFERIENSMMRKAIARRLTESKQQVPHFYLSMDVAMDRLMDLRVQLNDSADGAFKLSINDFIIKAVARALVAVPAANASWTNAHTLQHKHAHVSVAVAIEGGLITPVIRFAEQKGIVEISNEVKELATRARKGELKPAEYSGGTFSISNLGMYGVKQFQAIVNPPEGAILAVGGTEERAVAENGQIVVKQMMTLTLSCDHRVVDGAVGAEYLAALKKNLECPASVLL
ncbi:MAG: pyruvate dehydrogenase complex dihydrolipoamide acetyltransferase [Zetaproteobacteria bacterium CG_4_9_14_3_um_filter_49_83]|nr:MAG: pyruvate dehydrogenase complex dihydrolipoamide acetyltransferase [Zetaproteobacteria bacterium CG1_02_49_23]PIQ30210.1 MAG: pyruvate dehydrogenase complex dihydrolipoamide acetyltransferase [Zetaproteobacteria bacterium CG17_big_fil_post_rev_8_21_14_2_50_50_13]PIV30993.1 MAG: pyruvate dehydrogenase complex dihydrolipoamide acetyltransferase [Zetaproteobacteria bacterium CG02_land_8_20_14_3_00_50_9]PIY55153.1 MAG: pyruvate dehydrogenase complex dihydrolipoamide acetyltransferase [Zetapro